MIPYKTPGYLTQRACILLFALFTGCTKPIEPETTVRPRTRLESIPGDAVKMTPQTDLYPPVLHADDWEYPVPLDSCVNTAGAEDSPFIPIDRNELYFFFTPDVRVPAEKQVLDQVTGIYAAPLNGNTLRPAERVWLQDPGKLALDGAEFIQGNEMLFVSAREGYTGLHWFRAEFENGKWTHWQNDDFNPAYEVGELHIHGNELFYHSSKSVGKGLTDIWTLTRVDGEWQNPKNLESINTNEAEGWPYVSPGGNELWLTRTYHGTPAVFRSKKLGGEWHEPELIISQFAGEPTLNRNGDIYFVHHFYREGRMIEADIYTARRKK